MGEEVRRLQPRERSWGPRMETEARRGRELLQAHRECGQPASGSCPMHVLSAPSGSLPREGEGPAALIIIWAIKTGRWSGGTEHSSDKGRQCWDVS